MVVRRKNRSFSDLQLRTGDCAPRTTLPQLKFTLCYGNLYREGNNMQVGPMCLQKLLLRITDLFLSFLPSLSYNNLLNSCSSFQDLKCVHAQIITHGLSQNLLLATKLFALAFSYAPSMDYAHKMFNEIP